MERFQDRVVLVTGATGGIGTEICNRLAAEGAVVVVADLPGTPLEEVAASLPAGPHLAAPHRTAPHQTAPHQTVELDVASEEQWTTAVTRVMEAHGRLDALVNNAGIGSLKTLEDETPAHWQRVIDVDQTGVWLGMKHAGAAIERTGGGAIVNVCSILGSVGGFGNSFAYHAAKGAVRTMSKNAAMHWATKGVRVNSLHPGFIETPQLLERYEGSDRHRGMLAGTPMGRLGTPAEIAGCVAFLASDDAGFMTGSELYADGGWTAR